MATQKNFGCFNCRKAIVRVSTDEQGTNTYVCSLNTSNMLPISLGEYCSKHIHYNFRKT